MKKKAGESLSVIFNVRVGTMEDRMTKRNMRATWSYLVQYSVFIRPSQDAGLRIIGREWGGLIGSAGFLSAYLGLTLSYCRRVNDW